MDVFTIESMHDIGLSANLRLIAKSDDLIDAFASLGKIYQIPFRKPLWGKERFHSFVLRLRYYIYPKKKLLTPNVGM